MRDTDDSTGEIRLVLAGMSGLTADMVIRIVAHQPDMRIVRQFRRANDLGQLSPAEAVDVILIALGSGGIPETFQRRFFEADVPVIAISSSGKLDVFERRGLREVGLEQLLAEIRRVARAQSARSSVSDPIDLSQDNGGGNQ